ncbi:MAG TPA: type I pantothenate kinase [Actinomycetales bacterium]|nr:type I pantothenate kinase [Actinomycetales bacterium]
MGRVAENSSPFVEFDREQWSALAASAPLPLTDEDVLRLRALGDPIDLEEVDTILRPLTALLSLYRGAMAGLHSATDRFLGSGGQGNGARPTPYVIGVAGSVAVGKSSISRILRELMSRFPDIPRVQLVTTDGFLYPNAELERRGLMQRKGFPESFDRRALLRFVQQVKSGAEVVRAPVYSHLTYDIVEDEYVEVRQPEVLILEGLNLLQPPMPGAYSPLVVSDFFDFSIYVHAQPEDVKNWYIQRFLKLRETAFANPESYFHKYAMLSDGQAISEASRIWDTINAPNLLANIAPTRGRATLVLSKDAEHRMRKMRLRKI